MKTITMFESSDGQRFNSPSDCRAYEELAAGVADAMFALGTRPELSHRGYKQRTPVACNEAKRALIAVARKHWPTEDIWQHPPDTIHVLSFAGRLASEGPYCFAMAWSRLMCINWDNYREYGQPYFAMNPHEAEA